MACPHLEDGRRKAKRYRLALTIFLKLSWAYMRKSTTLDGCGYSSGIEYLTGLDMGVELPMHG
jgi:hypothetical protein